MDAIDCPHCLLRVLPTAGICPSCSKDVNDAALAALSRRERELADIIFGLKYVRTNDAAVLDRVVAIGFDREAGAAALAQRRTTVTAMRFEIAKMYLWPGYLAFVIGTTVTVGSMVGALNGGPVIIVCYGAVLYGAASVVTGHLRLRRCPL